MRFYFGFSKRIPIKWILIAIGGILAFFGITKVSALSVDELTPVSCFNAFYYPNNGQTGYNNTFSNINTTFSRNFYESVKDSNVDYYVFPYSQSSYQLDTSSTIGVGNLTVFSSRMCFSSVQGSNSSDACTDCLYDGGYYICPNRKDLYTSNFTMYINTLGIRSTISIPQYICGYVLSPNQNTQSIIDNNNQNTQQIIDSQNNINNSINNSQVDSSSTSGGGFFDNFSVDDSRGFSSIITAPLQFLRDLLTSGASCSPLSFDIEMKDDNIRVSNTGLSLPCGNVLWNRVPQAIELIWVTLVWGLVGYRLLLDMVKFINNSLNPEYSKEYFLDL